MSISPITITNTNELKTLATEYGSHFFEPAALRFFSSRIHSAVYGGRYFVTSEQRRGVYLSSGWIPAEPRRYTVRTWEINGDHISFDSVGEFQQYATRAEAHAAAQKLARDSVMLTGERFDNCLSAYLDAVLWQGLIYTEEYGEPVSADSLGLDFDANAIDASRDELRSFLALVWDAGLNFGGLTDEQIGHDFCLTRNQHGAGFWDRGLGRLGDELSHAARSFGTVDLYRTDDCIGIIA